MHKYVLRSKPNAIIDTLWCRFQSVKCECATAARPFSGGWVLAAAAARSCAAPMDGWKPVRRSAHRSRAAPVAALRARKWKNALVGKWVEHFSHSRMSPDPFPSGTGV